MNAYGHCPLDAAMANFRCAMSVERLSSTPPDELALALGRAPRKSNNGLSSVYIIGNDANPLLKIGYADNLKSRFLGLRCGSPVGLNLLHFVHVVDGLIAKRIEADVHKALAECRKHGEWFEITLDQASSALSTAILSSKVKWWTEQEARQLSAYTTKTIARHEERARFFGA